MGTGGYGERNKLIQGTASGRCRFELDDVILESVHPNTAAYCLLSYPKLDFPGCSY